MFEKLKGAAWFLGIILLFLFAFLPGYTKLQELKDKNRDLEVKIKKLRLENSLLGDELKRIESDSVYQEKIVRDRMGLVRKGEVPIKIVPEKE